jgi:uncharacterized repeat protein (TIGR03803 family)
MKRIINALEKFNCGRKTCAVVALMAALASALPAQTFTTVLSFDFSDGAAPYAALYEGIDGNLYGTTAGGGASSAGTVFKIAPGGALTTLYSFCSLGPNCPDGDSPRAGLVQAANGDFYGTTPFGGVSHDRGPHDVGTVYRITSSGALTTLYTFCAKASCTDGVQPEGVLAQGSNGDFYGITEYGGAACYPHADGCGTVFEVTPAGALTTLYSFCSQPDCTDGAFPVAGLVKATDGYFYGTTSEGGSNYCAAVASGCGTIFKISPAGTLTTLYNFCSESSCTDGVYPEEALIQATIGDLYGTTGSGGTDTTCGTSPATPPLYAGCGTFFKITPSGTLTTLYTFCPDLVDDNCPDGAYPSNLIQGTDGNFYGTTFAGGATCVSGEGGVEGCGTIFKLTPRGELTTLHRFCTESGCPDGEYPSGGVTQDTNGEFYGTNGLAPKLAGTVFSLSEGLSPFVEARPPRGEVGAAVRILGTNLTGATRVSFSGTAAAFTVVSGSEITTTVPTGATSGKIQVVTPGGTLSSDVPFRVP